MPTIDRFRSHRPVPPRWLPPASEIPHLAAADARRLVSTALRALEAPGTHRTGVWDRRVERLAATMADRLSRPDTASTLVRWARFHDVGKLWCLDLVDRPGRLTAVERTAIERHARNGAALLEAAGFPDDAVLLARDHHERIDGSGYPSGSSDLALAVRLLQVADIYAALRSRRPYKDPWPHDAARAELERERDQGRLCPEAVAALISATG